MACRRVRRGYTACRATRPPLRCTGRSGGPPTARDTRPPGGGGSHKATSPCDRRAALPPAGATTRERRARSPARPCLAQTFDRWSCRATSKPSSRPTSTAAPRTTRRAVLERFRTDWVRVLYRLLDHADRVIEDTKRQVRGPERAPIIEDFDREAYRIDEVLTELLGPPSEDEVAPDGPKPKPKAPAAPVAAEVEPGITQLQLSWEPGVLIAWAGGRDAPTDDLAGLRARLQAAGGGSIPWEEHRPVRLLDGTKADTLVAPLGSTLGLAGGPAGLGRRGAASAPPCRGSASPPRWRCASWPRAAWSPGCARSRRRDDSNGKGGDISTFQVELGARAHRPRRHRRARRGPARRRGHGREPSGRPGLHPVGPHRPRRDHLPDGGAAARGARHRRPSPGPAPTWPRRCWHRSTVALFEAPTRAGAELVRRLDQWSSPVTGTAKFALTVKLDPPDEGDAWHCSVLGPGPDGGLEPVEVAMVNASNTRARRDAATNWPGSSVSSPS